MEAKSINIESKVARAQRLLSDLGSVLVAFSGGVDSSVLLKLSSDTLGNDKVLAVTAVGALYPSYQRGMARETADLLSVRHVEVSPDIHKRRDVIKNTPRRCYFCKKHLLSEVLLMADREGLNAVVAGENADEGLDYRPGHEALREMHIRCPLKEAHLSKADIYELADRWDLPSKNQPPSPCLATRVAYGQMLSTELLLQIDDAENFIRSLGFSTVRVRVHGPIARIELAADQIARCMDDTIREDIAAKFKELGFTYTAVDLLGYTYGRLNKVLATAAEDS